MPAHYYPVFLDLCGRRAVVVGGGRIAERKILPLLSAGAVVTVISPTVTKRVAGLAAAGRVRLLARPYRRGDLKTAFIVVAATSDEEVNRRVAAEAPALLNVVDVPALCNFIAPSVIRRGSLVIAVSTSGVSPALAKGLRRELEVNFGSEFAAYLRFVRGIRKKALDSIADKKKREQFLKGLASAAMIDSVRKRGVGAVTKKILSDLSRLAASRC